ncbi:MAG: glucose-6-phosphate isomerase, partial [Gammaproteobacteria bacterium]|nr:glucose-6-phosphate isomerase [Gammaproteobacteria bacterium]
MNKTFKPSDSPIWDELAAHRLSMQDFRIARAFDEDPDRFNKMHTSAAGLTLDYSKNLVTGETISLLVKAAESLNLQEKIHALLRGDKVNVTEDRPALHTALRDFSSNAPFSAEVGDAFARMASIVDQVHSGQWTGSTGQGITDVVNIGIGGSHLGPMMVTDALKGFSQGRVNCHFVSNIDSTDLHSVLDTMAPETTLFIICSKSFTTLETLQNAKTARAWLEAKLPGAKLDTSKHFLAVSSKPDKAGDFGIPDSNVLPMWDWVGGRYSLWSAIGISIALSIGMENFNALRKGAQDMDHHFNSTSLDKNLPVLLALLDIWYVNYWGSQTQAVLPYCHRLRYFPEFLQQLAMESNGKSVDLDNNLVSYSTAPVTWGTVETNGQHSFHQLLHQGTGFVPVDFFAELNSGGDDHHAHLLANCLAQSNALMNGKSQED